ncbi:MAG: PIG-L family deacetylase [Deltaproteobacteria bacterium]|nr:PIG-L family deacetylase [Deltaproteobacteria bacterium]
MSKHTPSDPFACERLLAVVAHPDDETYLMGGSLARAARAGARVQVAFCTRGEAGLDQSGQCAPGPDLAALRTAEARVASRVLGLEAPVFLDLGPDSELSSADGDRAVERLAGLLVEHRPDLVFGLARSGVYGHRDHICCTRWLERALAESAAPARLLLADAPAGLFAPLLRSLQRASRLVDPDLDPDALGLSAQDEFLEVDIRAWRSVKLQAIAAHASQLPGGDPMRFLMPGLVEPLLDRECFVPVGA